MIVKLLSMAVGIRIYESKSGKLLREFPSITEACDYVKDLVFIRFQKKYSRKHIYSWILNGDEYVTFSCLNYLGIRVERKTKCVNECPELTFGTLCGKCERWGPPTKSLIQGKYYYMRVGEVFGPTDDDTE